MGFELLWFCTETRQRARRLVYSAIELGSARVEFYPGESYVARRIQEEWSLCLDSCRVIVHGTSSIYFIAFEIRVRIIRKVNKEFIRLF